MGRLICLPELLKSDNWFERSLFLGDGYYPDERTKVKEMYPHRVAFLWNHRYSEDRPQDLIVQIRRFVERECVGDVLFEEIDLTYWIVKPDFQGRYEARRYGGYNPDQYEVENRYKLFHCEQSSDAVLMRIRFETYVRDAYPIRHEIEVPEGFGIDDRARQACQVWDEENRKRSKQF